MQQEDQMFSFKWMWAFLVSIRPEKQVNSCKRKQLKKPLRVTNLPKQEHVVNCRD